MTTMFFHYDPTTGEIDGWDSHVPDKRNGFDVVEYGMLDPIPTNRTHKVDIKTKILIAKSDAEKIIAALPSRLHVNGLIRKELGNTDNFMLLDRPDDQREKWKSYRQSLRDLSKMPDLSTMVKAWPMRPDGFDPVSDLRKTVA